MYGKENFLGFVEKCTLPHLELHISFYLSFYRAMEESAVSSYICIHCGNVSISLNDDDIREQMCNTCGMSAFDTTNDGDDDSKTSITLLEKFNAENHAESGMMDGADMYKDQEEVVLKEEDNSTGYKEEMPSLGERLQGIRGVDFCISCSSTSILIEINDDISTRICRDCGTMQTKDDTNFDSTKELLESTRCFEDKDFENRYKYRRFLAQTCAIANMLNLPPEMIDQVTELARKSWTNAAVKRKRTKSRIAAAIYYVTRKSCGSTVTLPKISRIVQVPIHNIFQVFSCLVKCLNLDPLPYVDYTVKLEQFSSFIPGKYQRKVIQCAIDIESVVKIDFSGVSPNHMAAVLLKVASEVYDLNFSLSKLCEKFSISCTYLSTLKAEVLVRLFEVSQKIPWRPKNLKQRSIAKFFPEILRYHRLFGNDDDNADDLSESNDSIRIFREKVKYVIKMRKEGKKCDQKTSNDPVITLIEDLLAKGCTEEELCSESLASLSKTYLDCANDSDYDDDEIADEEVESLLK